MYYGTKEERDAYLATALTDLCAVVLAEPTNAPAQNELAYLEDLRQKMKKDSPAQVPSTHAQMGSMVRSQSEARMRPSTASPSRSGSRAQLPNRTDPANGKTPRSRSGSRERLTGRERQVAERSDSRSRNGTKPVADVRSRMRRSASVGR